MCQMNTNDWDLKANAPTQHIYQAVGYDAHVAGPSKPPNLKRTQLERECFSNLPGCHRMTTLFNELQAMVVVLYHREVCSR